MAHHEVIVHVPKGATTRIERDLVRLSALLAHMRLAEESHGVLGGEHGYGPYFYENDVFMFKSFCWCGRDDCPWCATCTCPPEAHHYLVDGKEVSFDEWMDFFEREAGEAPVEDEAAFAEWERRADAVNARRSERHDSVCEFCTKAIGLDKGAEPGRNAPNFWYKPGNLKIWWYKWIGRDMEYNRPIKPAEWGRIFRHCLDSIIADADRAGKDAS